jgi:hypothetical protein
VRRERSRNLSGAEASPSARARPIELFSTLLLTLAAVLTAWASYQAAHLRSEQGLAGNRSTAARIQANRATSVASRQIQIDVATFVQWLNATQAGDKALAAFYVRRFRPEFLPAFHAWVATRPLTNPKAPLTPFAMPEYRLAAQAESDALESKGVVESKASQAFVKRADKYTLCVVMFALALFFAGISTRVRTDSSRIVVLAVGWTVLLVTLVWMATFPATLGL